MIKGGGHWYALLFVFSFFLYSFISSFFSGCWLILSVYIIVSFGFPFVGLFGVRWFCCYLYSMVTFLGWTRLHATWIKPEVAATKQYTGYLHYRFITTGSRFLWSPCCSYMCFLEFLCGPAYCLSVYNIVFPMFWTFLWWVNGLVSGLILHML